MKFITALIFAFLALTSATIVTKDEELFIPTSVATILSPNKMTRLRQKIRAVGGCNINICFAIDGSGSISKQEFQNEINFVLDTVSVLVDNPVEFAATQYATSNYEISPLTADDESFILDVNGTKRFGGYSFVVGGVNYCFSQLRRRPDEANHIVLLGDGLSNIGASAVKRADLFRYLGGTLSVVGAGFPDNDILLKIAGGNKDLVYEVSDFLDVLSLEEFIEAIVIDICELGS